jgi:hypothetical protein
MLSEIWRKVKNEHGNETRDITGALRLKLAKICASKQHQQAMFVKGQLLFIVCEIKENNVYLAVFHIDLNKDSEGYKHEFNVKKEKEVMSVPSICRSYLRDKDKNFQPGESVVLPHGRRLMCLNKSSCLSCEIVIHWCQEECDFQALFRSFKVQNVYPPGRPFTSSVPAFSSPVQLSQDMPDPCKLHSPEVILP